VQTEPKPLPLPSVGDFLFLFVMQINLFLLPNFLFAEGSTGWHLVAGDFIVNTATIPRADLISNTFPDKAWVAYEWLFDVFIASMTELGGELNLLAVVLSAAIGFLFLAIYDRTRREGAGIMLSFSLVVISILVALTHWHARPHLVTFWCVWIFLTTLEDFYRDLISRRTLVVTLCLTVLLWVNCHPAFPLGFVILAMYVVSAMVQSLNSKSKEDRESYRKKFITLLILSVSLVALTFANPYGIGLHAYIFSYLQGSEILVNTQEFLSPVFKGGLHPTCLEVLFFAFAGGLFVSRKKISMPGLLVCLTFGHLSLSAVRNMPLYAIVVTPFIGRLWGRTAADSADSSASGSNDSSSNPSGSDALDVTASNPPGAKPGSLLTRLKKSLSDFEQQEAHCKMHIIPYAYTLFLIIVALNGGSLLGNKMLTSTFDPTYLPVKTVAYIKDHHIDMKHVFNFDNWGGYLRYKLGERVFMDDRADFYGLPFYARYSTVMAVADGWEKVLTDNKIDWILFPNKSALAATLRANKDWKSVSSDEASELFERVNRQSE
jgi:hypothetical protein